MLKFLKYLEKNVYCNLIFSSVTHGNRLFWFWCNHFFEFFSQISIWMKLCSVFRIIWIISSFDCGFYRCMFKICVSTSSPSLSPSTDFRGVNLKYFEFVPNFVSFRQRFHKIRRIKKKPFGFGGGGGCKRCCTYDFCKKEGENPNQFWHKVEKDQREVILQCSCHFWRHFWIIACEICWK